MLNPLEEVDVANLIAAKLENIQNMVLTQLEVWEGEGSESSGHLTFLITLEKGGEVEIVLTSQLRPKA